MMLYRKRTMPDPTPGYISIRDTGDWPDDHLIGVQSVWAFENGENRPLWRALPKGAYKVTGLAWPESMGDFTLMGPPNRLGAWRWYQRSLVIEGIKITERIKLDNQLQPIWDSLVTTHA
jgi:hypothetical protein